MNMKEILKDYNCTAERNTNEKRMREDARHSRQTSERVVELHLGDDGDDGISICGASVSALERGYTLILWLLSCMQLSITVHRL